MAFTLTSGMHVVQDDEGYVRHLRHLEEAYLPQEGARTPRELAAEYLRATAWIYKIDAKWLDSLEQPSTNELTFEGSRLAFAGAKRVMGTHTLSFAQIHAGLPVWEAGLSLVVQDRPLRVTSSQSTLHHEIQLNRPNSEAMNLLYRYGIAEDTLQQLLGPQPAAAGPPRLHRGSWRPLYLYRYDPAQRLAPECSAGETGGAAPEDWPTLHLPPLRRALDAGPHYVVAQVLFTVALKDRGDLNWRALIEAQTGSVLYLRGLFACATGSVYKVDPLSATGDATLQHTSPRADLNNVRSPSVVLHGLTAPTAGAPHELAGTFVKLTNAPPQQPPPKSATGSFVQDADTPDFAAVNAYYHCDHFFRLMQRLGFDLADYFDGTPLPVPVDHWHAAGRATAVMKGKISANGVTADGCERIEFGRVAVRSAVGIAVDGRIAAHEFAHVALIDVTNSATLAFAHSVGDSLAAVHFDPQSQAPKGETFPWIPRLRAGGPDERLHNRPVGAGWYWGGSHDNSKYPYEQEQILSTTLFRLYEALGGGATKRPDRQWASDYVVYLILYAVGTLPPHHPTPATVDDFATALMVADTGTTRFRGVPGGVAHKVIRWSFEKQGLYRPRNAPYTQRIGDPPPVDVYIDDGQRGGEYHYLAQPADSPDVWNRVQQDNGQANEAPRVGVESYLYVRVKNRGTRAATGVVVRGYQPLLPAYTAHNPVWPHDWQPLTTPSCSHALPIPSGKEAILGPFAWTPQVEGEEEVFFAASAVDDLSNIDPARGLPCSAGPVSTALLLLADNNLARRWLVPGP